MQTIASDKLKAVVGMGATGLSVARFLYARGERFVMLDTRAEPPLLETFEAEFPNVNIELGELRADNLTLADEIILSPGVPLQQPVLREVSEQGVSIIGDIELFAREAQAPVVAGMRAGVGGNLGTPALELLDESCDLYVLELSSFQLETVKKLNAEVAVVLNISPDHMDRYDSIQAYHAAKHRIFQGAKQVVVNRADALSQPLLASGVRSWSFALDRPDIDGFGLIEHEGEPWLAYQFDPLMPEADVAMKGSHNTENALAALALGSAIELPMEVMLQTLKQFRGLPHRCQTVADKAGVSYINDSKATNVGATIAAVVGLSHNLPKNNALILIAGGQGKAQDFTPLGRVLKGRVKLVVLIGEDARVMGAALEDRVEVVYATSLLAAVTAARDVAQPGDRIVLSPACASFDMFDGFEDRGEQFVAAVEGL